VQKSSLLSSFALSIYADESEISNFELPRAGSQADPRHAL
jgi:hypothetical protein